jgi:hypothetical protein
VKHWVIAASAVTALVLNSSCLAPVGQPQPTDGGDAGSGLAGCLDGGMCAAGETCDPLDGKCKCGPEALTGGGAGLVFCAPNETCDPDLGTCVSTLCAMKLCVGANSCDQVDGLCKCGGQVCPSTQVCDPTTHLCQ